VKPIKNNKIKSKTLPFVLILVTTLTSCYNQNDKQNSDTEKVIDTISKSTNTEKIKLLDSDQNNNQFCLERLFTTDIPENQSFRIFSTTDPRIEDENPQFFWLYDDKTNLRALYFKCNGTLIKTIETKKKTKYNGVNGIGTETYEEKTNFENDRYTIEIFSSPSSASMIYWDSKIQIKSKLNEIIIIDENYTGIEDSFD
jgi:hypothetical protein